ncbi:hypothetical protein AAVH_09238 [Aphelenchoides avenae]|nr:hypothetical protein AAVH_09238 [Aphelenchus avenae]
MTRFLEEHVYPIQEEMPGMEAKLQQGISEAGRRYKAVEARINNSESTPPLDDQTSADQSAFGTPSLTSHGSITHSRRGHHPRRFSSVDTAFYHHSVDLVRIQRHVQLLGHHHLVDEFRRDDRLHRLVVRHAEGSVAAAVAGSWCSWLIHTFSPLPLQGYSSL